MMKWQMLTVLVAVSLLSTSGYSASVPSGFSVSVQQTVAESIFGESVRCHWLTASSDEIQGEHSENSSEEDEEPDCE